MIRGALPTGRMPRVAAAALLTVTGLAAVLVPATASAARGTAAAAQAGWTAVETPVPPSARANPFIQIRAVACPSKRSCVAVGGYDHKSTTHPDIPTEGLLLKMSGTTWTEKEAPLPANAASPDAGQNVYLDSVACASTTTCVAAGWYTDTNGNVDGLLLTRSGTTWTAAEAPLPAGARVAGQLAELTSVACPSTTTCDVVGSYVTVKGGAEGVLLNGLGTSWTAIRATPASSILDTVACGSATSCAALGSAAKGLVLTGSGTSWTAGTFPLPTGETFVAPGFTAEQCPSATTCVGVGGYGDSSNNNDGMLVSGSGASWAATEAPLPVGAESSGQFVNLNAIACSSAASCAAGGNYLDGSGNGQGLLVTGSGTTWAATEAPLPSDASTGNPTADVNAIACPASASCIATGSYQNPAGAQEGMLLTGSGATWTATTAPLPTGASATSPSVQVDAVACPAATLCIATGSYNDSSGDGQGLLLIGP